ncbi:hypothetical protein BGW80DRAFT_1563397 [Lactifluus volemus]|nr:hypothetical protein BGW80DRAFT_1563397 [Lactifluus volemus]
MEHLCVCEMSRPRTYPLWLFNIPPSRLHKRSQLRALHDPMRARPRATIPAVTLPPGTRTGIARCLALTPPTSLTVSVVPAFRDTRDA